MKLEIDQSLASHEVQEGVGSTMAPVPGRANSSLRRGGIETGLKCRGAARSSFMTTSGNRRIFMKPPLISTLIPAVAIGGMALILGCGDESRKGAASAPSAVVATNLSVTASDSVKTAAVATIPDSLPAITKAPALSPAAEQLVQLAHGGVGDDVLLAFIDKSSGGYNLQVDEILYLHDVGLSAPVIAAMVRHDQASSAGDSNVEGPDSLKAAGPAVQSTLASAPSNSVPSAAAEPASVSLSSETPQSAAVAGPPTESPTYNYFYDNLAPYGNWVQDTSFGWCWQPTVAVVNPGWRPYCDNGRWLWTDCGWYWQSSYSWGCIPFHYGRWNLGSSGWMWVPGRVWGPSWVTWSNSGSFCGWAPLPPSCGFTSGIGLTFGGSGVSASFGFGLGAGCWTFVPRSYVCSFSPWFYCVPRSQVPVMVNNGTIVNNYINGSGNNVVVNVGPGINQIAAVSRTEIRKVALRDANPVPGRAIQADRLDRNGGALTVFRPTLPQQAPNPPARILTRQQEVRRSSESLVKSDVVQLARSETVQRATAGRSGTSLAGNARTIPSGSISTSHGSPGLSSRNDAGALTANQAMRPQSVSGAERRSVGTSPSVSSPGGAQVQLAARNEVRAVPGNSTRPVQWTAPQGTPSSFGRNNSNQRTGTTPAPVYATAASAPQANPAVRAETRNPATRPGAFAPRTYTPAPAQTLPTVVQPRTAAPGVGSPQRAGGPAPRSYAPAPVAPGPSVRSAPVRSSPAPSYSPAPSPSRSQFSGSPSPVNRSGSGR